MDTIILIGMPNAGKTSVGRILAHDIKKTFIDTDDIITRTIHLTPRQIVTTKGEQVFLKIQEELLINMDIQNVVLATGGSVVYSEKLMRHLKEKGYIIYLYTQVDNLSNRMTPERRIVGSSNKDFWELYNERNILYRRYAHKEIDCVGKSIQQIVEKIKQEVQNNG